MRLATKLVLSLVVGLIFLLAVDAYWSIRRTTALLEADMRHDAGLLGDAMRRLLGDAWRSGDLARMLPLIREVNESDQRITIRWVWLDGPEASEHRPRLPVEDLSAAREGQDAFFDTRSPAGDRLLVTYVPMPTGGRPAALELTESYADAARLNRATIRQTLATASLLGIGSMGVIFLLGRRLVGRPMLALKEKMRQIAQGDLSSPLRLSGRDELAELAAGLNEMCEQLAASRKRASMEMAARFEAVQQLRHADRLSTVGKLASGIAHELGTPLNVITLRAQMLSNGNTNPEEVEKNATVIRAQANRLKSVVRQMLDFARPGCPQAAAVDLCQLAVHTVALLKPMAERKGVELAVSEHSEQVSAEVDMPQIQQALTNLIVNAVQATPNGGRVDVEIGLETAKHPEAHASGLCATMTVRDNGTGIAEDNLSRVFDPFFTTKGVGEGTGLGLSIAMGIVREHRGWIDVDSRLGEGSRFSIYLPSKEILQQILVPKPSERRSKFQE